MCGIAGYWGRGRVSGGNISACKRALRHRGPDNVGDFQTMTQNGTHVLLIHTRLNIIECNESANQPWIEKDSAIVYNGELYNYIELREAMRASGIVFQTASDTEVLFKSLALGGLDTLDKMEGMWAFAYYDARIQKLHLCRDRFGEKPLYLYEEEGGVYFASEIGALSTLMGRKLTINYDQVHRYLINGYKALNKKPQEFFKSVRMMPEANLLTLGENGMNSQSRYWSLNYKPDEQMSREDAVAQAKEKLLRSVKLRLRADVPLAFCMSGGVDSNALIAVAKRLCDYSVHGFTIANTDKRYDERTIVDQVVDELGIKHTYIPVQTGGFLEKLRGLVNGHHAPVATLTYYTHYLLMESIADAGYKISLCGTAADELFSGYYDHHLAYLRELKLHNPRGYTEAAQNWEKHIKPIVRNPYLRNPKLFVDDASFRDHIFLDAETFSQYMVKPWREPFEETYFTEDLLRNRMMNELFHEAVPIILHQDDHNAMACSLENRSPFLDRELAEFCYTIPTEHLIHDGYNKSILRDAIRGIAPDCITDERRKVGFNAPIFSFLDTNDAETKAALLDNSPVFDIVKREPIEKLLKEGEAPNSVSKFLFYFINIKCFLEAFS